MSLWQTALELLQNGPDHVSLGTFSFFFFTPCLWSQHVFLFPSHRRTSTQQQGLIGLMINTNGSVISWPQAGISGLCTVWPVVSLEQRQHCRVSQWPSSSVVHTSVQWLAAAAAVGKLAKFISTEARKPCFPCQKYAHTKWVFCIVFTQTSSAIIFVFEFGSA